MQLAAFHWDSSDWEKWEGGGDPACYGWALYKTLLFLEHFLLYQDLRGVMVSCLYTVSLLLQTGIAFQWASAYN